MKTIKYKIFKNDEYYFKKIGNYNAEEKTIDVEDRTVVEVDIYLLKDYEPIHVTYINNAGNLKPVFKRNDYTDWCELYLSDYFREEHEELISKIYADKFGEYNGSTRHQNRKHQIGSELFNQIYFTINTMGKINKLVEKGLAINLVETELEPDVCVSLGGLYNSVKKEEKKEVTYKVVTMHYKDYKKTNFKSVKDSYDKREHTIDVYVPEDYEYQATEYKEIEMYYEDTKKYPNFRKITKSYSERKHTIRVEVPANFEYEMPIFNEVEMLFKDYKKSYSKYRTGKFYESRGTIIVYLPEGVEYVRNEKDEHYEELYAFKKGYTNEVTITPKKLNVEDFNVEVPECLQN